MILENKVTIFRKAANLAAAAVEIAKKPTLAPVDLFESRKKICLSCEFFNKHGNLGLGECSKCGCTLAKLKFLISTCPAGRWL